MGPAVVNSPAMAVHSWLGLRSRLRARASHAGSLRGGLRGAALGGAGLAAAGARGGGVGPRGGWGGVRMIAQNRKPLPGRQSQDARHGETACGLASWRLATQIDACS